MQENRPAPPAPLTGAKLFFATVSLSLATLMIVIDTTIANVSIPAISGDLGVSTSQGTWVITFFAVANAVAVPLTGWLIQRLGQIKLFVWSVALFILSSFLCGMAWNIESLIGFRIMQGFVAGPVIPLSMSLLLQCYPREKAGMAIALWSMTVTVAPIAGPILGGWLTDNISWPWIFYVNIPIGIVSLIVSLIVIGDRESVTRKLPVDKIGLALLITWVGCFQIMLDKGKELDWFGSPFIIVLAVVSVVAFAYFLVWELTEKHPIIDLSLFRIRNFTVSTITLSLGYGVFFMNIVLVPLWLQKYMGYTATWAGLVTAAFGIFAIILSPFVGKGISKYDPRLFVTFAFTFFSAAFFMRSGFSLDVDAKSIALNHLFQGIGMAAFMTPLNAMAVAGLAHDRIGAASGLINFARIMMGAFSASVGTTIWENRAAMHHARLTEEINSYSPVWQHTLDALSAVHIRGAGAYAMIENEINRQSYMFSTAEMFKVSGILILCLICVVWLARPKKVKAGPDSAGGH
ncbi:DHA2 family efflux MFS transporter permease subunit [Seleniivibrio woodruffii]|uniref:DHA2 family efflux MFS transporter permease subunit n=1 Tax=Seleniivibrio woodruffii TaxID=1078050 RepID=UPI0026F1D3F6|nr:DHA2 family efflux MFS transporter permease subunit [Seleniivibrio woodruffii]